MLESMRGELQQIKVAVGATNKRYIKASSACANRILGFLIDTVNTAQDSFTVKKNLSDLQLAVSSATALTRKLLVLDLDSATRARVTDNLETIEGISKTVNIAATVRANRASSSDGVFDQIPVWLWIVGAIFLLSMCSG
jgi:hypothetical protein